MIGGFFLIFPKRARIKPGWVNSRLPRSSRLNEPSPLGKLHWNRHVLASHGPESGRTLVSEISAKSLVNCSARPSHLILRVDPNIQRELVRVIHLHRVLSLSEPQDLLSASFQACEPVKVEF